MVPPLSVDARRASLSEGGRLTIADFDTPRHIRWGVIYASSPAAENTTYST